MRRRGFTLIEMLVATGVFMLGFSAAYTLFLAGVRYRTQAAATQRLAFALTSLAAELTLSSGKHAGPTLADPSDYVGNGMAIDGPQLQDPNDLALTALYPFPGLSGVWYRVMACSDLHGQPALAAPASGLLPANQSATLHARILVLTVPTDDTTLSFDDLRLRYLRDQTALTTPEEIAAALVDRGLALQCETVLLRRASWL